MSYGAAVNINVWRWRGRYLEQDLIDDNFENSGRANYRRVVWCTGSYHLETYTFTQCTIAVRTAILTKSISHREHVPKEESPDHIRFAFKHEHVLRFSRINSIVKSRSVE